MHVLMLRINYLLIRKISANLGLGYGYTKCDALSKEQPVICEVPKAFILISLTDRDSKSHVGSNGLIEVVFSTERHTRFL